MATFVLLAIVVVAAIALSARPLARREQEKKRRLLEEQFGSRDHLDAEAFFQAFFAGGAFHKEVVLGVREVLEEVLESDLSFLRGDDDFSQNLNLFWEFDSMANVELVQALEARFKIAISDAEAERTKTVRDLIELVQTKTYAAA